MHFSSLLGALAAIAVTGVHKVAALQPIAIDSITLWNGWQHQNVTLATREVDLSPQTTEERSEELSNSTDFGALEPRGDRFDSWPGEKFDCKGSSVCRGRWMVAACDKAVAYIKHYDVYRAGRTTWGGSSGVCHKNGCGIFIQAWKKGVKGCTIRGDDLRRSYELIRAANCKHCGKRKFTDGCAVKIDFVSRCETPKGSYNWGSNADGKGWAGN